MKSFLPTNTEWWKHRAFWKLDAKNPRYPTMWHWLVKEASVVQRDGRLELSGGSALGAEDFALQYHRATEEEWQIFLDYCIELGILALEDGVYSITIWKQYFNLVASATPDGEKYRKQAQRAKKKADEVAEENARLKRLLESSRMSHPSNGTSGTIGTPGTCPKTSKAVPERPECPEYILDHIRSDHIRSKDKRSDNSAREESLSENPETSPPETPTEFPATWSADLFSKQSFSSTDLLDEIAPDYRHLAALRGSKPKIFTTGLKTQLLQQLAKGAFANYLNDPLVQLIALRMACNNASDMAVGGYVNADSVWPYTLQDAERCLYAASRICEQNREHVQTGEVEWVPPERAFHFIPTTVERQEQEEQLACAGGDTS
jgi:hypothetical protein